MYGPYYEDFIHCSGGREVQDLLWESDGPRRANDMFQPVVSRVQIHENLCSCDNSSAEQRAKQSGRRSCLCPGRGLVFCLGQVVRSTPLGKALCTTQSMGSKADVMQTPHEYTQDSVLPDTWVPCDQGKWTQKTDHNHYEVSGHQPSC